MRGNAKAPAMAATTTEALETALTGINDVPACYISISILDGQYIEAVE